MSGLNESVFYACSSFIIMQIITFLSGGEKIIRSVCALSLTLIVLSSVWSAFDNTDFNFEYIEEEYYYSTEPLYLAETQNILVDEIKESLEAAGIYQSVPQVILSIDDAKNVSVDSVIVGLRYNSDIQRARLIVNELFSDSIDTEVYILEE